jgi:hypothetical protein
MIRVWTATTDKALEVEGALTMSFRSMLTLGFVLLVSPIAFYRLLSISLINDSSRTLSS